MGSMRNPVGPLPSSIYWRRRAVAATLIALLALLVVWVVTSGGGDGGKKRDDGANGEAPAPSITPGPSGSGPAISEQPGGRDESGETGGSGGSGGGDQGGFDEAWARVVCGYGLAAVVYLFIGHALAGRLR
ncbi:hypothetical protein AB0P45_00005, partial [Streptomyces niveus]